MSIGPDRRPTDRSGPIPFMDRSMDRLIGPVRLHLKNRRSYALGWTKDRTGPRLSIPGYAEACQRSNCCKGLVYESLIEHITKYSKPKHLVKISIHCRENAIYFMGLVRRADRRRERQVRARPNKERISRDGLAMARQ